MATRKSIYNRKWRYHLRHISLQMLGGVCVECGSKRRLEFHHKNPANKVASIAWFIRNCTGMLPVELRKCELRCHKCHVKWHDEHKIPYGK